MKNMSNQIKRDVPQIKGLFCQSFYLLFLFFSYVFTKYKTKSYKNVLLFFRLYLQHRAVKEMEMQEPAIVDFHALQCHVHDLRAYCFKRRLCGELHHLPRPPFL